MKSRIQKLFDDIEKKKKELSLEYEKIKKKYDFEEIKGRIRFSRISESLHKRYRKSAWKSIFLSPIKYFISMPFIYVLLFPVLILDVLLFIYQQTAFRLYGIPRVKRSDYIVYDRYILKYLNWLQKINCMYCSYMNGFLGYAVEISGRTEAYWCPVKHAKKNKAFHPWQKEFADYGDPK